MALGENTSTFSLLLFFSAWWQARPHTRLEPEGDRLKNARCRSYNRIASHRLHRVWNKLCLGGKRSLPMRPCHFRPSRHRAGSCREPTQLFFTHQSGAVAAV